MNEQDLLNTKEQLTCVSLPLPEDSLKELTEKAKDWAIIHGASMRSKTNFNADVVQCVPFVLFPTVFKADDFNKVVNIQSILNELVHNIANNREFLKKCLKDIVLVDKFTSNLFRIYETVQDEGVKQKVALGLLRSDYMSHSKTNNSLKQVELNTIASSLAGISSKISKLHKYILQELNQSGLLKHLPENNAVSGLSEGMLDAWKIYGNSDAVILFVIEDITYNISDQRFHEFEIRRLNPTVKVIRRTLTEICLKASLSNDSKLLIEKYEVAVIYFRAGYEPDHYPSQKEWDARLLMERSMAIKCPNIQYHLTGTKKVQQELAKPGVLEMFLNDPKKILAVRELFVGLYGLDFDELGEQTVQMALGEPDRFVLKPQREGGGNNVYGAEVREVILKMKDDKERTAWILMERIIPPIIKGYIVKPDTVTALTDLVSELGIYGVIIGDEHNIIVNRQVGHMIRTKSATADEGGVAAGIGALDSPFLIE